MDPGRNNKMQGSDGGMMMVSSVPTGMHVMWCFLVKITFRLSLYRASMVMTCLITENVQTNVHVYHLVWNETRVVHYVRYVLHIHYLIHSTSTTPADTYSRLCCKIHPATWKT
jgi:hypothetical protein